MPENTLTLETTWCPILQYTVTVIIVYQKYEHLPNKKQFLSIIIKQNYLFIISIRAQNNIVENKNTFNKTWT